MNSRRIALALAAALSLIAANITRANDNGTPEQAVAGLDVVGGLEVTLFAAEPLLFNPTNIDIDAQGRVWVCENLNYRSKKDTRPEGDRILVLEDTNGDGKADKQTVFHQGRDVDSAMGICVLGNRVIVSVSPNVFIFTDTNGDLKADKRELLFSNTGQEQHDHSAHAFTFGPDGKLYWNFGNTGKAVHDKDGKPVVDMMGREVVDNGKPYFGGMAFRCNPDGSEFEVLAHNFRNNYEIAVDSFGNLWQSDNDDDGNRGVRINYLLRGGNYGYRDEMTGAGWHTPYLGMPTEIPLQHWHLTDPGVCPNLLQTGAGSPTGILFYEGNLLPKEFQEQIFHCDAGPNVVRAYPLEVDGAGYKSKMVDILKGTRDTWFRPSDICVAPDGSLIVADWYDPGVGGHRMEDVQKGRLFRIAPPKTPYTVPKLDFTTLEGVIEAVKSPNLATRYLAWTELHDAKKGDVPRLWKLATEDPNPRLRARALWDLARGDRFAPKVVQHAIDDPNPDIRVTGIRIAQCHKLDVVPLVAQKVSDGSKAVLRECALALRGNHTPEAARLWAVLASRHDAGDRWYLEALGIGAEGNWDACLTAFVDLMGDRRHTTSGREIIWRSRATTTPLHLAAALMNRSSENDVPRFLRAFDFQPESDKKREVLEFLALNKAPDNPEETTIAVEALKRLKPWNVAESAEHAKVFEAILSKIAGTADFALLVDRFSLESRYPEMMKLALEHPEEESGIRAALVLLKKSAKAAIEQAIKSDDPKVSRGAIVALGNTADARAVDLLLPIFEDTTKPIETRRDAVMALGKSERGAKHLIALVEQKKLDDNFQDAAAAALNASTEGPIRRKAHELFPPPPGRDNHPLPPVSELVKRSGDVSRGKLTFNTTGTCLKCHTVDGVGKDVGPALTEIGDKLSRQALYDSILFPSAGISHNFETHVVLLQNGTTQTGIITSRTPEEITLKDSNALARTFKTSEIDEIQKQNISLMPADLQKLMTADELVDVVEYMTTLKKKK